MRAELLLAGKTATGIRIPPDVVDKLGSSKRPPVRVTINGYTYRSTIALMGGEFMLGVSAEVRAGAGVAAGDTINVDIVLDEAPREIVAPPDLAAALKKDKPALRRFEALSYSHKRRWVESIEQAKTDETRQRRIAKAVTTLHDEAS